MRPPRFTTAIAALLLGACAGTPGVHGEPPLRYVGSSTIGNFIRDADPAYGAARFVLDTERESAGGEAAIVEGRADVAGIARPAAPDTLARGVRATLLGYDAIAVVVHPSNPLHGLSREVLKSLFTGRIRNWSEVGGPDLPVRPFIVARGSATRTLFRSVVLGKEDYAGCETVRPDAEVVARVAAEVGGIGTISFSFLESADSVHALAVDGVDAERTRPEYPLTRPLYLLWWPGRARVADFVEWVFGPEARAILERRFVPPAVREEGS